MAGAAKNTLYFTLGKIAISLISIIVVSFLTNNLGAVKYGSISIANSIFTILLMIVMLGFHAPAVFLIPKYKKEQNGIIYYLIENRILIALTFGLIFFLSSGLISNYYSRDEYLGLILPLFSIILFFSAVSNIFQEIFVGLKDMKNYFAVDLVFSISKFAVVVLIIMGLDIIGAVLGYVFSYGLMFISGIILFLGYRIKKEKIENKFKSMVWKLSIPMTLLSVFEMLNVHIQNLFLGKISGLQVSYYSISMVIAGLFLTLGQGVESALAPEISEGLIKKERIIKKLEKAVKYLVIYSFFAGTILVMLGERIILTIFGKDFSGSGIVLSLIILGQIFFIISHVYRSILFGHGKPEIILKGTLIQFALTFLLCFLLSSKFAALGTAFASFIGVSSSSLYFFIMARRKISFKFPKRDLAKAIVCSIVMLFVINSLNYLNEDILGLLVILSASSITFLISAVFMKLIWREDFEIIRNLIR